MRPYFSLNTYLQNIYGEKVYKLALNGGMSCPNRDGLIDMRGCIFCSVGGSGDFASSPQLSVSEQIEEGKALLADKYTGTRYIAYFQAYTNTYAPVEHLRKIFTEAITHPDIVCLSIATRPDCLPAEVLELLAELNQIKPVWVELGLQTIHKKTADYIRRGYELEIFDTAVANLHRLGIEVITHMIIGLPGETTQDMLDTAAYISQKPVQGIKLQLLHVLKNTDLASDYENGFFQILSMDEYINILISILEILPPDMVIHRLTGDGPRKLLIAPEWSLHKRMVLNTLNKTLKDRNTYQGRLYDGDK